ncbi:MAG: DUF5058 family protein [Clostridia bacterium]
MFSDFKSDGFMLCIALLIIGFVVCQSLFFVIRAIKRAKQIGITNTQIKSSITSSAMFSIAPAIGIAMTVLVLSVALGNILPWIRLSVLGSITYEVPAAEAAIEASGLTTGISSAITDPTVFATTAWVMTLGSILPLILIPLFLKKIQSKVSGAAKKNSKWTETMSAAAFIGLIAAFLGRGISGLGEAEVLESGEIVNVSIGDGAGVLSLTAIVSSVVYMVIFVMINKKLNFKWLEAIAMPLSMILAMLTVVMVSNFFPDFAAIEWRY